MKYRIYYQTLTKTSMFWGSLTYQTLFEDWPWTETQIKAIEKDIINSIQTENKAVEVLLLLNVIPLKDT